MYEQRFGTDWETVDRQEAIVRAYAVGVASRLGEEYSDELERLEAQIDTSYDRSFVTLAYQKGRTDADDSPVDDKQTWDELIEERTEINPLERESDFEWDVPEASSMETRGLIDIDTLPDDSRDVVRRPSFLDRESVRGPANSGEKQGLFGRSIEHIRRNPRDQTRRPTDRDESSDRSPSADGSQPTPGESTDEPDATRSDGRDESAEDTRPADDESDSADTS